MVVRTIAKPSENKRGEEEIQYRVGSWRGVSYNVNTECRRRGENETFINPPLQPLLLSPARRAFLVSYATEDERIWNISTVLSWPRGTTELD